MCRLLGYAAARPMTADQALGATEVTEFVDLARLHCDGWGTASVADPGLEPEVFTSQLSAQLDPDFLAHSSSASGRAGMLHLRWATNGLAVRPENTHPFLADGMAFAHNGSVDRPTLAALLEPEFAAGVVGTTDSELYFAVVRQYRRDSANLADAVYSAVRRIRAAAPTQSLNALVIDGRQLVAVHASSNSSLSAEDQELCRTMDLPAEHHSAYFRMRMRRTDDAVHIGSTGFGRSGWEPLPLDCVVAVNLVDLTVVTRSLSESDGEAVRGRGAA
jgi:predicted glutamine amidotransferase